MFSFACVEYHNVEIVCPMLSVSVIILKYLTCNFDDLELGLFKVIQCQRSLCQWKAHSWFPILTSIVSSIVSVVVF